MPKDMNIESTQEEWDAVPTIVPRFRDCSRPDETTAVEIPQTPSVATEEAFDHLRKQDLSYYMSSIEPTIRRGKISKIFMCLVGPPPLLSDLEEERNTLFAIAECQLDPNDEFHNRMLQTVYKGLTGLRIDCPRFGNHWEQIGFQGTDPGTDLRGAGLLGLLQLVHLATNGRLSPLARAAYSASQDPHSGFPLAVLSLNLTKATLQALREGALNRECNSQKGVMCIVMLFYAALLSHTLRLWQTRNCTLKEAGFVLKDAETYCRRKMSSAMKGLQAHLRSLSAPERCSPRARFVQAGSLQQLASQAKSEVFI